MLLVLVVVSMRRILGHEEGETKMDDKAEVDNAVLRRATCDSALGADEKPTCREPA